MLSPIKMLRGLRAVARITLDPTNLPEVFVLVELTERSPQTERLVAELRTDPSFARAMRERPRLGRLDLDALAALPAGTVGHAYAEFMTSRGLRHEDLELVEGESDFDWVRNHLRETHDLWHVLTGFDTDVAGELGAQAVYLAQLASPLPTLLLTVGMLNTLLRAMDDSTRRIEAIARGWLIGKRARPIFGLDWRAWLDRPLDELRRELGIDLASVDELLAEEGADRALRAAA